MSSTPPPQVQHPHHQPRPPSAASDSRSHRPTRPTSAPSHHRGPRDSSSHPFTPAVGSARYHADLAKQCPKLSARFLEHFEQSALTLATSSRPRRRVTDGKFMREHFFDDHILACYSGGAVNNSNSNRPASSLTTPRRPNSARTERPGTTTTVMTMSRPGTAMSFSARSVASNGVEEEDKENQQHQQHDDDNKNLDQQKQRREKSPPKTARERYEALSGQLDELRRVDEGRRKEEAEARKQRDLARRRREQRAREKLDEHRADLFRKEDEDAQRLAAALQAERLRKQREATHERHMREQAAIISEEESWRRDIRSGENVGRRDTLREELHERRWIEDRAALLEAESRLLVFDRDRILQGEEARRAETSRAESFSRETLRMHYIDSGRAARVATEERLAAEEALRRKHLAERLEFEASETAARGTNVVTEERDRVPFGSIASDLNTIAHQQIAERREIEMNEEKPARQVVVGEERNERDAAVANFFDELKPMQRRFAIANELKALPGKEERARVPIVELEEIERKCFDECLTPSEMLRRYAGLELDFRTARNKISDSEVAHRGDIAKLASKSHKKALKRMEERRLEFLVQIEREIAALLEGEDRPRRSIELAEFQSRNKIDQLHMQTMPTTLKRRLSMVGGDAQQAQQQQKPDMNRRKSTKLVISSSSSDESSGTPPPLMLAPSRSGLGASRPASSLGGAAAAGAGKDGRGQQLDVSDHGDDDDVDANGMNMVNSQRRSPSPTSGAASAPRAKRQSTVVINVTPPSEALNNKNNNENDDDNAVQVTPPENEANNNSSNSLAANPNDTFSLDPDPMSASRRSASVGGAAPAARASAAPLLIDDEDENAEGFEL